MSFSFSHATRLNPIGIRIPFFISTSNIFLLLIRLIDFHHKKQKIPCTNDPFDVRAHPTASANHLKTTLYAKGSFPRLGTWGTCYTELINIETLEAIVIDTLRYCILQGEG